jgi:hypothetical protein
VTVEDRTQVSTVRDTFLSLLAVELRRYDSISAELVTREGRQVLFVVSNSPMLRTVEIGADYTLQEGWWYSWITDPNTIAPVQDVEGTADVVIKHLRTRPQS